MPPKASTRMTGPRSVHERPATGRNAVRGQAGRPPFRRAQRNVRAEMNQPGNDIIAITRLDNRLCPFLNTNVIPFRAQHNAGIDRFQTAQDLGLLDRNQHEALPDRVRQGHHAAKIVHLITGRVNNDFFNEFIQLPGENLAIEQLQLDNARKNAGEWQRATAKFIFIGVIRTRALYQQHALDVANPEERRLIWKRIFDRAPLQISKGMIGARGTAVNLEQIFSFPLETEPRRSTWRKLFRILFVWSCDAAYKLTIGEYDYEAAMDDQDALLQFYATWRSMPALELFQQADPTGLWTVENCPARRRTNKGRAMPPLMVAPNEFGDMGIMGDDEVA